MFLQLQAIIWITKSEKSKHTQVSLWRHNSVVAAAEVVDAVVVVVEVHLNKKRCRSRESKNSKMQNCIGIKYKSCLNRVGGVFVQSACECVRLSECVCSCEWEYVRVFMREREREWGEASMEGDKRGKSENIALKRSSKGFLFLFTVKNHQKKNCA